MTKFDFENMHKNQKWAFIDGLLTGAFLAIFIRYVVKSSKEVEEMTQD